MSWGPVYLGHGVAGGAGFVALGGVDVIHDRHPHDAQPGAPHRRAQSPDRAGLCAPLGGAW